MTTMKRKFKSDAFEAIHASAAALHQVGAIVTPPLIDPKQIKRIRERAHVSQPVFARYLNTSESTVQKWEAGTKRPSGMALKLLAVVEKHGLKVLT